ncbi:DUF3971 domain-containing protein [Stella sp.]|uniref:YhdP family protein n=1 Tax=Stella sp. TaxID=2912054 RepID=UPI0035B37100
MVRRSARILLEILGALVAGATIAVALVAWRLSAGPISLEFLTPYLEEALSEPDGRRIEIGQTVVVWRGWEANPELRAETVVARAPDGRIVATVPALAIAMSLESLLRGVLAPARVELVEPRVHLVREADGRIRTDIGGPDDRPGDPTVVETVLGELMAPLHRRGPLGQLRRLAVRDATIIVDDRRLGRVWTLPDGDLVFRRGDRGLDGTLSIDLDLGPRRQRLDGTFVHRGDSGTTRMELRADVPDPPSLAGLLPELAPLQGAVLPLHVGAALDLRSLGTLDRLTLDLRGGAGRLVHDVLPGGTLEVSAATARLDWDATAGRVELEDLFLDLGGPTIAVTARAAGIGPDIVADLRNGRAAVRVAAEAAIVDVPTPTLWRLWPATIVPNGRRWVSTNIADGRVRDAQIKVEAVLPGGGGEPRVEKLDGVFSYEGLTVTYLNGLPPVRQAHGTARFDDQQMVLDVAGGVLGRQTRVDRSTVRIVDFQKRDQQILIESGTSGPAREALEVIDRPRLGFLARFGLRPADVSGDSTVRMSFAFPAIDSLRMDDVRLKIAATVARGAMPVGVQDWRLTDAELAFDVDKDRLEARGTGRLQGVPVTLSGREVFAATAPVPSEYMVRGRIDEAARRRLGYDYAPWVRGPADVDLTYRSLRERRSELSLRADLTPAILELAPVGWSKPAGQRATAELAVDFQGDQVRRVRGLKVAAPGLAFDGAAEFGAGGWVLDIAAASLGETRLAGRVRPQGNGYAASLRGPLLDLGHLLDAGALDGDGAGGGDPAGQEIHLDARFDRVLLGQGRELTGVAAEIDRDRQGRRRVRLDGRFARGGAVRVAIDPGADGRERLVATADDFGAVMATFAGRDTLRDGRLRIEGTFGAGAQRDVLSGTVQASDYRLVRAPAVTKVLSVLSLTSMASLLQGDGLPFADLRFDFVWSKGRLEMRQGRAYGGAIGGTFEGALDFGSETLDLAGTLVPAYTLNNLLGNIPVLGTLLAGGRDEGVFAANYRMAGPLDDPGVSVNPLSALAPGILRKIVPFLGAGDPRNGAAAAPDFRQDGGARPLP